MLVETVDNGVDALAALLANHYDAALLDIKMPGLSGVEIVQALRQYPDANRARVPLIALTANALKRTKLAA